MSSRPTGAHLRHDTEDEAAGVTTDADAQPVDQNGDADQPSDIGGRGWKAILTRTAHRIKEDRIQIVAAALAFYALLAAIPALVAAVSIYGLVADPSTIQDQISQLAQALPPEAASLVETQLTSIVQSSGQALGWTAAIAILGALWSASSGVAQLIKGINIAYREEETRGFFKKRGLALAMTLGLIVFSLLALSLIVVVPPVLNALDLGQVGQWAIQIGRFALLAAVFMLSLAALYRFAPDREQPRWHWLTWGAVIATLVWIVASLGFSVFVSEFGSYQETYGALAGVIILMLWFLLTAFVVLLGAELNSEIEAQASTVES